MSSHYNPNQPRVPAGHHEGGQWADGGSHEQAILNSPLFDRGRLIKAALGIQDVPQKDKPQLALLDDRPPAIRLPPPLASRAAAGAIRGLAIGGGEVFGPLGILLALGLFEWWSLSNDEKQHAIISFKANEYRRSQPDAPFALHTLEGRTPEEVKKICGENFTTMQKFTNEAYNELKASGEPLSPQNFGNKVHKNVEIGVRTQGTFSAEPSFALIDDVKLDLNGDIIRGQKGTVRPDCYDRRDSRTACIYDIKTGKAGLSPKRIQDFLKGIARKEPCIERVIVTEIRPNDPAVPVPPSTGQ